MSKEEIKIGDEVIHNTEKYIVTAISNGLYFCLSADGQFLGEYFKTVLEKTGKHFDQIADIYDSNEMAIKAVDDEIKEKAKADFIALCAEQEPKTDTLADTLDKISAEIEQNVYPIVHGVNNHEKGMTLYGILQIIDKYTAEGSDKE